TAFSALSLHDALPICPLLALLVLAGLQYAGAVRLEEYLAAAPNKVEPRVVWLVLAGLALPHFLCGAIGVLQGWGCMRRAKQLRRSEEHTSELQSRGHL